MTTIIDGSGSATFATPLPIAKGGTSVGVSPAFDAYLSALQNVSNGVYTKIALNVKAFEIGNSFDAVTNYRFQPTVAGYYQVNTRLRASAAGGTFNNAYLDVYKNGVSFTRTCETYLATSFGSALIFLNGSTDYLEFWGLVSATGCTPAFDTAGVTTGLYGARVSAFLARAA